MNKRGNINQLFPAVMAIILIGALLAVGLIVITNMKDTTWLSTSTTNANFTAPGAVKEAGQTFASGYRNAVCSGFTCYNQSGTNLIIPTLNRTVSGCNVKYTSVTEDAVGYNNTIWKCTYAITFDNATAATTAMASTETSLSAIAVTWLPILIVVIAAGIVLSILLGAFSGKRK